MSTEASRHLQSICPSSDQEPRLPVWVGPIDSFGNKIMGVGHSRHLRRAIGNTLGINPAFSLVIYRSRDKGGRQYARGLKTFANLREALMNLRLGRVGENRLSHDKIKLLVKMKTVEICVVAKHWLLELQYFSTQFLVDTFFD